MREFDYVIIGGGCSGLSLAYELEINKMLDNKSLAIIEPRQEYKRDKTWSFWKVSDHNFDDEFVRLARLVYHTNDQRFSFKSQINKITNSELTEEKILPKY